MAASTEKENITKIRDLVEQIERLRAKEDALHNEIKALLKQQYPSSDRAHIDIFKELLRMGRPLRYDFDSLKSMLKDDRIIYDH